MNNVLHELLKRPFDIKSTRSSKHGKSSEIIAAFLHLKKPTSRISRTETRGKPFSALGELLWYLSGTKSLKFIEYYIPHYKYESEDGKTIFGGYGKRLFNLHGKINQVKNIIDLLYKKPSSRRAVIQLFDAEDLSKEHKEIPCTCTLQFLLRNNHLNLIVNMRSNDAFLGLPHDVFAFTMLQEIISRTLNVELGEYFHSVGSLHLYSDNIEKAKQYLDEGFQSTDNPMPSMPRKDPWPAIAEILNHEKLFRLKKLTSIPKTRLDSYWADLSRLLFIHSLSKTYHYEKIDVVKQAMTSNIYNTYIDSKIKASRKKHKS
jgi:thymidylate synthase